MLHTRPRRGILRTPLTAPLFSDRPVSLSSLMRKQPPCSYNLPLPPAWADLIQVRILPADGRMLP